MSVEIMQSPENELALGRRLVALERRRQVIEQFKISSVIVILVVLLALLLLLMRFDEGKIAIHFRDVLEAAGNTIYISVVSIIIASVLALLGAMARLSKNVILNGASSLYVSVIRGTPLLIQIFLIYNGLPRIREPLNTVFGVPKDITQLLVFDAIPVGIIALSVNYGAYMTEIFRAGIQSVSHGQREAAEAIGMSPWQIMRRITLPQAIRIILPDVGNQFIAMQKDSSLVSVIGVWEIVYVSTRSARSDGSYIEMYLLAGLMYWVMTIISTWGQQWLEHRMAHAYER